MKLFGKLNERRLRYLLIAFFLALAIPAAILIAQAYQQLKWESFRSNQLLAEDFAARVDTELLAAIRAESERSFGDYAFLVVEGDAATNFVQRSPLAAFPVESAVPGVIGYFQVDAEGQLTTPLLPADGVDAASYGVSPTERKARQVLATKIRSVLAANRLVPLNDGASRDEAATEELVSSPLAANALEGVAVRARAPSAPSSADVQSVSSAPAAPQSASEPSVQAAFDALKSAAGAAPSSGAPTGATASAPAPLSQRRRGDLAETSTVAERQTRTEQALVPEPGAAPARETAGRETVPAGSAEAKRELVVRTFASELDPFELGLLGTGDLVMFRNVWRDGQRYVQGALIDRDAFLSDAIGAAFRASSLAGLSDLTVSFRGAVWRSFGAGGVAGAGSVAGMPASDLVGTLLYRARLSPPFGGLELAFSVNKLPRAPGSGLLGWLALVIAIVLSGGFLLMYRFAAGQMRLARQRQDFVSAVSHELKTPLTSIRMYGEMLKAGWADEARKKTYYDYIYGESERLSHLIENVLQLSRLGRNTQPLALERIAVGELMDMARSKISSTVERAGFVLEIRNVTPAGTQITVDADGFAQILINLVDNALKFSASAEQKRIEIASRLESDGTVLVTVRDFGPGVPKAQMKKIFELFYRPPTDLSRETGGTGIGLALVRELATAMGGRVDVRNVEPGAEFRLSFPA